MLLPLAVLRQRTQGKRHDARMQASAVEHEAVISQEQQEEEMQPEATAQAVPMSVAEEFQASPAQGQTLNDADIFVAYGRHAAARELLEQELESAPERHDLRLKLLSIYIALDEREAAERETEFLQDHAQPFYHQEARRLLASLDAQYEDAVFEQAAQGRASFETYSSPVMHENDPLEPGSESPAISNNNEKTTEYSFDEHVIDYQPPSLQAAKMHYFDEHSSETVYLGNVDMPGSDKQNAMLFDRQSNGEESWDIHEMSFESERKNGQHLASDTFRH